MNRPIFYQTNSTAESFFHLVLDITLDFITSTWPLTEDVQKYVLVFRHLGVITSYPRWALVVHEKTG